MSEPTAASGQPRLESFSGGSTAYPLADGSAFSAIRRVGRGEVGRLVLGFVPSALNEVLPSILRVFGERFPAVELFLREMRPDRVVQRLHEKQIDAGFLYLPLDDDSLNIECVSREPLVLALPETHPLASNCQVELQALAGEPFILPARYQRMPGLYGQVTEAATKRDSFRTPYRRTSGSCRRSLASSPGALA